MDPISSITACILAGGFGTRLRAAVPDRQKVMAEVAGRPFLTYILDRLCDAGMRSAVLCTGYLGDQVYAMLGGAYRNIRLAYSQEPQPLGTAGALRLALPLTVSDPVLVLNGDSFCDADLRAFLRWHGLKEADLSLSLVHVPDTRRYGRVEFDAESRIRAFIEKSQQGGAGWISAGIYAIRRTLVHTIPAHGPVSLERDMLPVWLADGCYGWCERGRFLDIGTPESYAHAEEMLCSTEGT
jgi:NDP-sugar pyrophosphorylase family protein